MRNAHNAVQLSWFMIMAALGGCVGGDSPSLQVERGSVRIWIVEETDGGQTAQVGGRISYLPGPKCFVATGRQLEPGSEEEADFFQPVFWPRGTDIVDTDPPTLEIPGYGRLTAGDVIFGGGASGSPPEEMDVPAECFGSEVGRSVMYMQRTGG
jgi:hypothetical protein